MAKEEFGKLGFATDEEYERIRSQAPVKEGKKEGERKQITRTTTACDTVVFSLFSSYFSVLLSGLACFVVFSNQVR